MLYKKNKEKELSLELFKNPTSEYRSAPFWAWNADLDREELSRQIDVFSEMGFGGFHMHVRQGLESEYLGEDFLGAVKFCTERAKEKGMLAWLYDEDRWPSGVAGGKVTEKKKNRAKYLSMVCSDIEDTVDDVRLAAECGKPAFIAAFSVEIDGEGRMTSYKRIPRDAKAPNKRFFFLCQKQGGEPRYNCQDYVDTMSKSAIDDFISITHESFRRAVGEDFGEAVPAIFTDEPQVQWNTTLKSGFDRGEAMCPWTTDFAETYEREYSCDLVDSLPELFFATDLPSARKTRYNYYRHVSERFSEAYMDNIAAWCEKSGIALTGHVLGEDTLWEAALNIGDIMRAYKNMQLPGVDLLCDDVVFNTPIQCRSVVRQYGREAMLSELYGVTGWDFDFRGHKYQGDWQACLGVNVRVPHLAWQTMKGEGKRDYPASISYQSAWYKEYKYLEDHYARINTAMTRGEPLVNIAVMYPIDSYNILFASDEETMPCREEMEERYKKLTEWLLSSGFDFDFLSEALLPELAPVGGNPLAVGKMKYDVVIVSDCTTLRPHTVKVLSEFKRRGGRLVFLGKTPRYIEGEESRDAEALTEGAEVLPHSKDSVCRALSCVRRVDLKYKDGTRTKNLMCNMRRDGESLWLFAAHMYKPELPHLIHREDVTVTVSGCYRPTLYDTLSGDVKPLAYRACDEKTEFDITLYDLDTMLVKLEPTSESSLSIPEEKREFLEISHPSKVDFSLSEPNVLVLDLARFSLDGEPLSECEEEILRIDARIREKLGFMQRRVKFVQPWAIDGAPEDHKLRLVYKVSSETCVSGARLALENAERARIFFNSEPVSNKIDGYYIDRYVRTVPLPEIPEGESILEIEMPFGLRTDVEACYLIGDFGVAYVGREARITPLPEKLHFGSVVNQGLAFYGANIEYSAEVELPADGALEILLTHYRGALVGVSVDGEPIGRILSQPFLVKTGSLKRGTHKITYTLYGTRYNTLTALHNLNADKKRMYIGPIYWRSEDEAWAYEYQTRPMGILKTPVLRFFREGER